MRLHRRRGTVFAVCILLLGGVRSGNANTGQPLITVGPTVWVSASNASRWHEEDSAGADLTNPNRLLACSMAEPHHPGPEGHSSIFYESNDGGGSWHRTLEVPARYRFNRALGTHAEDAGDPICGFTADGKPMLFVISQLSTPGTNPLVFFQFLSSYMETSHATWSRTDLISGDREFMASTRDPHSGKIATYLVNRDAPIGVLTSPQRRISGLAIYRSDDGGRSFPTYALYIESPNFATFGQEAVFSDDSVIAPIMWFSKSMPHRPNGKARIDGLVRVAVPKAPLAQVPEPLVTVDHFYGCDSQDTNYYIPELAVNHSMHRHHDAVYVAWLDDRPGRCALFVAHSYDRGKTWSRPVMVDDYHHVRPDSMGPDDANSAIAVNRDGVVGVIWYDRRNQSDDLSWQPRFAVSTDGGKSFSRSVVLTDATENYNAPRRTMLLWDISRSDHNSVFHLPLGNIVKAAAGETVGLAADASGVFHPVWVDNRTGIDQLWTTTVRVDPSGETIAAPPPSIPGGHPKCTTSGQLKMYQGSVAT